MKKSLNLKLIISLFLILGTLFPITSIAQPGPTPNSASAECAAKYPGDSKKQEECYKAAQAANTTNPQNPEANTGKGLGLSFVESLFKLVGEILMRISAAIMSLSGLLFDVVVEFTIVKMAANLSDNGVGSGINLAWQTLRDIANMGFIFILLFAAFKAMFELDFGNIGKTVINIIIIALLINFSLFFTKVVIDASNIVAIGFYKSIVTANAASAGVPSGELSSISEGYMRLLGMQSWYQPKFLEWPENASAGSILLTGVLSSIFFLIVAIILVISSIMFLARFIILIFLMILSPLALIAFAIPNLKNRYDSWVNALIEQSFFAPMFFAITWIVFKLGNGLKASFSNLEKPTTDPNFVGLLSADSLSNGAINTVLNFTLIIGFAIAALVFSKQMAMKSSGLTRFDKITGGIMDGTAWGMRQTIGRGANAALQSSALRNAATDGKWGSKYLARAGLWTAYKGSKGSFDVRGVGGTTLGKALGGKDVFEGMGSAGGKGGFVKSVEDKAKEKAEYAKSVYGQTAREKELAATLRPEYEAKKEIEDERIKSEKERIKKEIEENKKAAETATGFKKHERIDRIIQLEKELEEAEKMDYSEEFKSLSQKYESANKGHEQRREQFASRTRSSSPVSTTAGGIVGATIGTIAGPVGTVIGGAVGAGIASSLAKKLPDWTNWIGNKEAARRINSEIKSKPMEQQIAEWAKKQARDDIEKEESQKPETPETKPKT